MVMIAAVANFSEICPLKKKEHTFALKAISRKCTRQIVGGFEFTVLLRNLKELHERPWTYVRECY